MFSGVKVRDLCKTLETMPSWSLHRGIVMLEQAWNLVSEKGNHNATADKDILFNCVLLTLLQKFGGRIIFGCDGQVS